MKIELNGRKALVTGSTAGIGRAIAEGLARAGATVVVNGRTKERVDAALKELRALLPHADFIGVVADVSTAEGSAFLAAQVKDVDILVNNAGTAHPKDFFEQNDADWLDLYQLNVMSGVRASRHYMPGMIAARLGTRGVHQQRVRHCRSQGNDRLRRHEDGPAGRVERVGRTGQGHGRHRQRRLPGPTRSEIMGNWMKASAKEQGITQDEAEQNFLDTTRPSTLINRFATTEEVANLVVYVCSQQSSGTTGSSLRVDGGVVRSII